ncbi:hypothetical protein JHK82_053020 [Glycine max]|nr:hypothetical protein JHK86_052865 [Glycine max]KAG4915387.1 hypothetical protein JHK87_052944 [Glycine soja]KAG4927237.1 hypothetical protein JHK85_053723 [Glycine max]KAG5082855.1 hypothetical protein JHK84_052893 [Glycine max]KAG5085623.1 hypothetical protein JHK82_053020 [Glycine max]
MFSRSSKLAKSVFPSHSLRTNVELTPPALSMTSKGNLHIEREKKSPDKVLPEPLLDKVLPELLDRVVKSLDVCNAFTLGLDAVKTLGGALVSTESQSLSTSKVLSLRPRRLPPTLTLGPTL